MNDLFEKDELCNAHVQLGKITLGVLEFQKWLIGTYNGEKTVPNINRKLEDFVLDHINPNLEVARNGK